MQVEPSTRFANRALDSGELFLRRRPLYPTELRAQIRYNPRQGRPNTFRLGGGRSILLSNGCMWLEYLEPDVSTPVDSISAGNKRCV